MDKEYLPLSYFEGCKPANNYQPDLPYTLKFFDNPRPQDTEEGYKKLYLRNPGADSLRFIKLRQKDENWYIWEYSGILMDIRKPLNENPQG